MIPNQISIRFIHELCFGVYTNRIRWRGSCRNSARLSIFFKIPHFPFFPGSLSIPQASETNRTSASDLWVLSPSQTNVQDAPGSVRTSASTAFTKSSSVRVGFRYGTSIRPDATSKNPIRPVVPWRIYSNSVFAHCPGRGSLSGYLCSSACIPVISSVEMICCPSRLDSCAF